MIAAQRAAGGKLRSAMTVEETRNAMRLGRAWQEPPPEVPVRDAVAAGVPVRLYGPESAQVLLFLHGGRFFSGDLETHDWPLRQLAGASGRRICAVDYRLAPEHPYPAALEDTLTAGRWLRSEADQLFVGGDSAGGYLAARACVPMAAARQLLIYPMLDPACDSASYREFHRGPWPSGEDMKRGWDLFGANAPAVTARDVVFPPTLLVTAGVDPLRDEATGFAESLRERGVQVKLYDFPDMAHGFFTQTKLVRSRELMQRLALWLSRSP